MCVNAHHDMQVEVKGQPEEMSSLLAPYGSRGLKTLWVFRLGCKFLCLLIPFTCLIVSFPLIVARDFLGLRGESTMLECKYRVRAKLSLVIKVGCGSFW